MLFEKPKNQSNGITPVSPFCTFELKCPTPAVLFCTATWFFFSEPPGVLYIWLDNHAKEGDGASCWCPYEVTF